MHKGSWFTGARLSVLPPLSEVTTLAARVRRYWEDERSIDPFAPDRAFASLGWQVRMRTLNSGVTSHRALLIPLLSGGFTVLIDPQGAGGQVPGDHGIARTLAHELAHTFFYSCGRPPSRLLPLHPDEETFCDVFADVVLGG